MNKGKVLGAKKLRIPWREATDEQLQEIGVTRSQIRKSYLDPRTDEQVAEELQDLYDQQLALRKNADAKYAALQEQLKAEKVRTALLTAILTALAFKGLEVLIVFLFHGLVR